MNSNQLFENSILENIYIEKEYYILKDAYRYLKIKPEEVDEDLANRIDKNLDRVLEASEINFYGEFRKLNKVNDSQIVVGDLIINSKGLVKNLKESQYVYIFGVTLGIAVDRLIHRLSISSASDSLIADAIASDLADGCADIINSRVSKVVKEKGYKTYPRFSPGFVDYSLSAQKELVKSLNLKSIGISTTDSGMMVPTKSVTAIIGIVKNDKE